MGIETEQRLRELEQRLAALESGVRALEGRGPQPLCADEPLVKPPAAKRTVKTGKSKAAASGAKRRA